MNRIITISAFGCGGNERGSTHNNSQVVMTATDEDYYEAFVDLRKYIKANWKYTLSNNSPCIKEFRYYISISSIINKKIKFKAFTIDPKNMR